MKELFIKDVFSCFKSKFLYVALFIYAVTSYISCFYMGSFFKTATNNLFSLFYFQPNILSFIIPAVAVKLWTEERRSYTIELLLSQPVSLINIVLSKFLACLFVALIMLFITVVFFVFASFKINIDYLSVLSSYFAVLLSLFAISAVCCVVASFFINPAISYVASLFCVWTLFFFGFSENFLSIMHGYFGLDNVLYFLTIAFFAVLINFYWVANKFKVSKAFLASVMIYISCSVFFIIIAGMLFSQQRVDMSYAKSFSLSSQGKEVLKSFKKPVYIELYSSDFSNVDINKKKYIENIARFLRKIPNSTLEIKPIKPFSNEENVAVDLGFDYIEGADYNLYSGIVFWAGDRKEIITNLSFEDANYLEGDVIRVIASLNNDKPKTIGVLAGDPNVIRKEYGMVRGLDWPFIKELKKFYKLISLPEKITQIPMQIDLLLVVNNPKNDMTKYAIDQFIMRGGRVIILENNIDFGYKNVSLLSKDDVKIFDGDFISDFKENIIKDVRYQARMFAHATKSENEPILITINKNLIGDANKYSKKDFEELLVNIDYALENKELLKLVIKSDVIELESIEEKIKSKISGNYINEVEDIEKSVEKLKNELLTYNLKAQSDIEDFKNVEKLQKQIKEKQNRAKEIAYEIEAKSIWTIGFYVILNTLVFPIIYIILLALCFYWFRRRYVKI